MENLTGLRATKWYKNDVCAIGRALRDIKQQINGGGLEWEKIEELLDAASEEQETRFRRNEMPGTESEWSNKEIEKIRSECEKFKEYVWSKIRTRVEAGRGSGLVVLDPMQHKI